MTQPVHFWKYPKKNVCLSTLKYTFKNVHSNIYFPQWEKLQMAINKIDEYIRIFTHEILYNNE